jgi:transmembrane sensor
MQTTKTWDLIAKKLSGEASSEELTELEILLKANPELHYSMQTVADLWHHNTPDTEDAHLAFSAHAARMKELGAAIEPETNHASTITSGKRRNYLLSFFTLLFLLPAGYYLFTSSFTSFKTISRPLADKSEVSTKYGSRTNLRLPDGTQVWLNSGSKLSYDKTYGNTIREVSLSGEAYFDVVKNPAHPFVIHTGSIEIKVLGTAFNVKSFPGEKNIETSLIRGSIEVTFKNRPSEKIILKPNEKLITANEEIIKEAPKTEALAEKIKPADTKAISKQEPLVLVSHLTYEPHDSTVIETSWMDNKLIFRSEPFEELAVKMERWYGVNIRFADEKIKPKRLNGIFENESIQQALQALQLITPFTYTINKNDIAISSK